METLLQTIYRLYKILDSLLRSVEHSFATFLLLILQMPPLPPRTQLQLLLRVLHVRSSCSYFCYLESVSVPDMIFSLRIDKGSMQMVEHQMIYSPEKKKNSHIMTKGY
jgi:hypothetical protein